MDRVDGRSRAGSWWRCCFPCCSPAASPSSAQNAQPSAASGRTIEAIEFRGLKALPEDTLRYYLGIEPGQALDEETLNRNIKQLWDRGLVDDVAVESIPTASGVRLVITVQERPILRSIEYEGLKRISKTDLQDKLTTQRVRVREGEPLSLGELQRVKTLIEEMYAEKGYRFANGPVHGRRTWDPTRRRSPSRWTRATASASPTSASRATRCSTTCACAGR